MKTKKLLGLISLVAWAFVGFTFTACSDEDEISVNTGSVLGTWKGYVEHYRERYGEKEFGGIDEMYFAFVKNDDNSLIVYYWEYDEEDKKMIRCKKNIEIDYTALCSGEEVRFLKYLTLRYYNNTLYLMEYSFNEFEFRPTAAFTKISDTVSLPEFSSIQIVKSNGD